MFEKARTVGEAKNELTSKIISEQAVSTTFKLTTQAAITELCRKVTVLTAATLAALC